MTAERAAPLPDAPGAESTFLEVNGVTLHAVTAGDPADPLVVLLHGFPEFWYGWRESVAPLVDAGYRVVVPDQRGYNRSEKPDGIRPYRVEKLCRDVAGLVAAEERASAHVVGHDWGGTVAWHLALRHPAVVDRLGILNVPHPTVFARTLRSDLTQLRKSWYAAFFQVPRLPEWLLTRRDFEPLVRVLRDTSNPGTFTDTDVERYRAAWARDEAVTAMLDWYRAFVRHGDDPPRETVAAPTLVVWGENDRALVPEMAPRSVDYCPDGRLERFPDATHWVIHEYPDRVTDLLLDHLGA